MTITELLEAQPLSGEIEEDHYTVIRSPANHHINLLDGHALVMMGNRSEAIKAAYAEAEVLVSGWLCLTEALQRIEEFEAKEIIALSR